MPVHKLIMQAQSYICCRRRIENTETNDQQVAYLVNKGLDGDMDSVNNFDNKVLRAKAKAMI